MLILCSLKLFSAYDILHRNDPRKDESKVGTEPTAPSMSIAEGVVGKPYQPFLIGFDGRSPLPSSISGKMVYEVGYYNVPDYNQRNVQRANSNANVNPMMYYNEDDSVVPERTRKPFLKRILGCLSRPSREASPSLPVHYDASPKYLPKMYDDEISQLSDVFYGRTPKPNATLSDDRKQYIYQFFRHMTLSCGCIICLLMACLGVMIWAITLEYFVLDDETPAPTPMLTPIPTLEPTFFSKYACTWSLDVTLSTPKLTFRSLLSALQKVTNANSI